MKEQALADAQAMLREQAEGDIQRTLAELAKLGISVSVSPVKQLAAEVTETVGADDSVEFTPAELEATDTAVRQKSLDDFALTVHAYTILAYLGVKTIGELENCKLDEIEDAPGATPEIVTELQQLLETHG
jgi:hypothetical protein